MTAERVKKRRWFQVHLSTAVLLMLTSGFLFWANLSTTAVNKYAESIDYDGHHETSGWPFEAQYIITIPKDIGVAAQYYGVKDPSLTLKKDLTLKKWRRGGFILNFLVALAILATTAFACEFLIRRRARKQQEPGA